MVIELSSDGRMKLSALFYHANKITLFFWFQFILDDFLKAFKTTSYILVGL